MPWSEVAATIREINHPNLCATLDFGHAYIECTYRGLDFMDELPRHPTGKLYKRLLRDPYWAGRATSII